MVLAYTDAAGNESIVTPTNPLPIASGTGGVDYVKVSGNLGALNAVLAIVQGSRDTLVVHVQNTFVGTISLQGSGDGSNWVTLNGATQWQNVVSNAAQGSITATGIYQTTISALPYTRLIMSAYTSGTASLIMEAVDGNAAVFLDSPLPSGGNEIGFVRLRDSAGTGITLKPASTGVAATDPSLPAQMSPNYVLSSTGTIINLAATTNGTVIKGSAGSVMVLDVSNYTGTPFYLKLYNSATVTVGTTVPAQTILVPTGTAAIYEFGQYGKRFPTGICVATTANATDTDATAIVLTSGPAKLGVTFL